MSIVDEIKATLASDTRIHHPAAIAVSERGGAVRLRGTVASLHQHRAAVEIARSTYGVATVDDELCIDPRDHFRDDEVRGTALQALVSNDAVPAERVDVSVSTGAGGITNEIKVITAGGR